MTLGAVSMLCWTGSYGHLGLTHAYTTHGHLTWHTNYNLTSAVSEMQDITSVREGAGMWNGGVGGTANEARPTQVGKDSVKCKLEGCTYINSSRPPLTALMCFH